MNKKILLFNGTASFDSTLLIPLSMIDFFEERVKEFGGVSKLFQFVANSKHPIFNDRPLSKTGRTTYASEGLNLQKVNFKPRNEDWEKFKIIAQSLRISMTFLFVLLLMFWNQFETDGVGVPEIPPKISLLTSLTVGPLFTRIHLCRHKI